MQAEADTERPWGRFDILTASTRHVVATVTVRPGQSVPLHSHRWRREVWTVLSGSGLAVINGKRFALLEGQTVFTGYGEAHSLENNGHDDLVILETQTGSMCSPDDVCHYTSEQADHYIDRTRCHPGEGVRSQLASYVPPI